MNILQGISSGVDEAEEIKSEIWKIRKQKTPIRKAKRKRIQKNEASIRSLWDNFKCTNICNMGVPGGEQGEQEIENLLENIMRENFPNLVKEIDIGSAEFQIR